jgi:hypothetical protein
VFKYSVLLLLLLLLLLLCGGDLSVVFAVPILCVEDSPHPLLGELDIVTTLSSKL